jgi:hypothetical protein
MWGQIRAFGRDAAGIVEQAFEGIAHLVQQGIGQAKRRHDEPVTPIGFGLVCRETPRLVQPSPWLRTANSTDPLGFSFSRCNLGRRERRLMGQQVYDIHHSR